MTSSQYDLEHYQVKGIPPKRSSIYPESQVSVRLFYGGLFRVTGDFRQVRRMTPR